MNERQGKYRLRQIATRHLKSEFRRLVLAAGCAFGVIATQVAGPWPIKIMIDNVLLGKPLPQVMSPLAGLIESNTTTAVAVVSCSILAIALLRGLFSYSQIYVTSHIGYQIVHGLRLELFTHLQRLPLTFHKNARTGELVSKINGDTAVLKDVCSESVLLFGTQALTVLSMLAIMFLMNWQLGFIVFMTLPALTAVLFYQHRRVRTSVKRQRRREGQISSRLNELLASAPLVQAFGRSGYEIHRYKTDNVGVLEDSVRAARLEATATRMVEVISALGTSAVVFVGAVHVINGRLTPGDLLIFTGYLNTMYRPIRSMAKLSTKFSKAMVSAERIAEILDAEPEVHDTIPGVPAKEVSGTIEFQGVSFAYRAGEPVLKDITCRIEARRLTALVGASGSGKSTFVSLILRLYRPQAGTILLDGIDLSRYQVESLRQQIAIVQQDTMLMGASIRDNIAYGKLDATEDEIVAAAKLAMAHEFIERLENGYETIIGERGCTLSGGEQRRIAIARAIIRNAPLLILDEPMAGLDAASEAKVREALAHLTAGKTCLLVTHDLHAADEADHVLVFDRGRIVEQGHPRTLLAEGSVYPRLHNAISKSSYLAWSGQGQP